MKKIFIKAITVVTLILCLSLSLAACGNKGGADNNEKPQLGKVPYANIVSDSEKTAVNSFLEKITNAFSKPFEVTKADENGNKKDLFFTASGVLELYPASTDTSFEYEDQTKTIYTKFDFQAIIDQNITASSNKTNAIVSVVIGGSKTLNKGDEITAVFYYDASESENVLISVSQPNKATVNLNNYKFKFEKKIKVGNLNDLIKALPLELIPIDSNPILDLLKELDADSLIGSAIKTMLGTTLTDFANQQLTQLFTRMLFNGTDTLTPAFADDNDTYSMEITSQNLNNALKSFFNRGVQVAKAIKNNSYNPLKDFINNNDKDDVLNNDSDMFFSKFESLINTINSTLKQNLSNQLGDWADLTISDNALNIKTKFTKTDYGISNGEILFNLNKNSTITIPKYEAAPTTITLPFGFAFKLSDLNFAIKEYSATDVIDQGAFADKITELKTLPVSNILDVNEQNIALTAVYKEVDNQGNDITDKAGNLNLTEKQYTVSFAANVDLFSFLKLDKSNTAAVNNGFVEAAFDNFELTVKNSDNLINFNAKWDNENKKIVITKFETITKEISSSDIAAALLTAKEQASNFNDISLINIIQGFLPGGGSDLNILNALKITVSATDITIPVGIDNALLKLFGLDYKTLFGLENDIDIASELFPAYTTGEGTATKYYKIHSIKYVFPSATV